MHTNRITPARVYLHPAALTSLGAVRAIETTTGRVAYIAPGARRIHLLSPAEVARSLATQAKAGAA